LRWTAAFALVGLVDELWSGVAVVAAPEVEKFHEVDHAHYTLWVFAVPILLSSLIEAPIALVSDRLPRQLLLASGLGGLAVSLVLASMASSPWLLAAALSLAGAASGVACDSAQAELVTRHPGGPALAMTRWIAFAAAGDALTPLAIAAVYWIGGTHRSVLALCGVLLGVHAYVVYRAQKRAPQPLAAAPEPLVHDDESVDRAPEAERPQPSAADMPEDEESASMPLRAALAASVRKPRLWLFLFGSASCALLDEVVVALAALRLHQDLGWTESHAALVMSGLSAGGVIGALISERLLASISSRRLLAYAATGSLLLLSVIVMASSAWLIISALFLLGMTCSLHWPLVKAAAYELVPGQPGVVNALQQAFVGMDIGLPLLIGVIASQYGLATALASLTAEPIILLIVALYWHPAPPKGC
jgi:MFS family permease